MNDGTQLSHDNGISANRRLSSNHSKPWKILRRGKVVSLVCCLLLVVVSSQGEDGKANQGQRESLEQMLNKEIGYYFSEPDLYISLVAEYLLLVDMFSSEDEIAARKNQFRENLETRWETNRDPMIGVAIGAVDLFSSNQTSVESLSYIREAADQGLAEAYLLLGMAYADGVKGIEEDWKKASEYLKLAAEAGSSLGMLTYGDFLASSFEKNPDYKGAVEWYRNAVEAGSLEALASLGRMYRYGQIRLDNLMDWTKGQTEGPPIEMHQPIDKQ